MLAFLIAAEAPVPISTADLFHSDLTLVRQGLDVFLNLDPINGCNGGERLLEILERVTGPSGAQVSQNQILFRTFAQFGWLSWTRQKAPLDGSPMSPTILKSPLSKSFQSRLDKLCLIGMMWDS